MDLVHDHLVIHYHLLNELRTEIIETEVCVRRSSERHVIGDVSSESPGIFEDMVIERPHKFLSGREDTDIVYHRSRISESASSVCPDHYLIDRHILERHTRRGLESLAVEPVAAKSCNGRELLACMKCIFSEYADICQICHSGIFHRLDDAHLPQEILIIPVEGSVQSDSETM